ncbi:hypothetical protein ACODT4_44395 [Streptomyces sp. 2.9]|uniref:hypothetical protein n=1 Tax=Streptomyces tritrimontium TaxID=3406573 RepID=UPI003BB68498
MASYDVRTHLMPGLRTTAKEFAIRLTHLELRDAAAREEIVMTIASDAGTWAGLDPDHVYLVRLLRETLSNAAAGVKTMSPDARYRVVLEVLSGAPEGNRLMCAHGRTELITN